jgi:serralysin
MPKLVPNTQTGSLTDHERGTDDSLFVADLTTTTLYGDAFSMFDHARGGDDTLTGIGHLPRFSNLLFGDASEMHDHTRGGDDTLTGGSRDDFDSSLSTNTLYGDAFDMNDNARGGNDTLTDGAASFSVLGGDAAAMYDNAVGGNDTLIGDAGVTTMLGDAGAMFDHAIGGNDLLVSGAGTDRMWGDAQFIDGVAASPTAPTGNVITGADTFVFRPGNGGDFVYDFRQSDGDRIDVSAFGFNGLADMVIIDTGADTRIEFDASNTVTLVGLSDPNGLHASDFIFA